MGAVNMCAHTKIRMLTFDDVRATFYRMEMVRKRPPLNVTLDRKVLEALGQWLAGQEFPPSRGQVIDRALTDFLKKRGVEVERDE